MFSPLPVFVPRTPTAPAAAELFVPITAGAAVPLLNVPIAAIAAVGMATAAIIATHTITVSFRPLNGPQPRACVHETPTSSPGASKPRLRLNMPATSHAVAGDPTRPPVDRDDVTDPCNTQGHLLSLYIATASAGEGTGPAQLPRSEAVARIAFGVAGPRHVERLPVDVPHVVASLPRNWIRATASSGAILRADS